MNRNISGTGLSAGQKANAHRASSKQPLVVRTIAVGGAALCIGFLADMNAPDAEALSILLPSGNGNATQINILEGNIFNPQFGAGGNVSNNTTIADVFFGQGNHSSQGTSGGGLFGPVALGGASGNGNVTQINILSFNIFNPQVSVNGDNYSNNTTVSNVAVGNGNYSNNSGSSGGTTMFGGAIGNGNTQQISLFSGNIFNPQFSLFGDNYSNNTAVTNVSLFNGNFSNNSGTGGSGFAGFLGSLTGNGNTNQIAAGVTNIFNGQFTFGGKNTSDNDATTNLSGGNGNHSNNEMGSDGGGTGAVGGANGNGNTTQTAWGAGNNINDQLRLGTWLPGMALPAPEPDVVNSGDVDDQGTNATNTWLPGMPVPEPLELLVDQGNAIADGTNASVASAAASNTAGPNNRPRPLSSVVKHVKDAVDRTKDAVNKALGIDKPAPSGSPTASQPDSDPPGGDESESGE